MRNECGGFAASMNSLPLEGKVPERGGSGTGGMKESGKMRLKQAIYESTLSTADAVPLPRWGRQISSGYAAILRLRSQLFWHSLSHI